MRSGSQVLVLHNTTDCELVIRIERAAPRHDALTAARAASIALFRELFPGEVLAPGQLATVSTVTLLFTALDPAQADALYHELGDARAFSVIHEHLKQLGDAIRQGGGAVVKTMGEGVLASFSQVTAPSIPHCHFPPALIAASRPCSRACESASTTARHWPRRSTTSSTTSARQSVTSSSILSQARDGELLLTEPVAADLEVAALLHERGIETEIVPTSLPGHRHLIRCGSPVGQALA